ncbi:MAG: acyl-CoA reductase [Gemmatimonadota bacterium]
MAKVSLEGGAIGTDHALDRFPGQDDDGLALERPVLDQGAANRVVREVQAKANVLRGMSNDVLVESLGRAGERFLDPGDPLRRKAEAWIPPEAGLTPELARQVVEGMAVGWTRSALSKLVRAEFQDPEVLERFRPGPEGTSVRALGGDFALHIGAGNVPGVGATSLLRSLLVRSPVLLKPGRGDVILPVLLARAIEEELPELEGALAVVYWPGGESAPLEAAALQAAQRVVVYGGLETISSLRVRLPVTTPLVAYHHRFSLAAVARENLGAGGGARAAAGRAAGAVAAYDQRGCVSPHLVWVEEGGEVAPREWAALLAEELQAIGDRLPPSSLDSGTSSRIQQLRGVADLRAAAGRGDLVLSPDDTAWTVLFEPEARLEGGCGGRLVRVQPVADLAGVPALLGGIREVLQSFGLDAPAPRRRGLAEALAVAGLSRVSGIEDQPWPLPWSSHDGQGPLRALVRWVTLEDADGGAEE